MFQTVFILHPLKMYVEVFTYFLPILKNSFPIFKPVDGTLFKLSSPTLQETTESNYQLTDRDVFVLKTQQFATQFQLQFLGPFAKLQKAAINFMFVCLSVSLELGSHWTDFHEILHLSIFQKSLQKIQFALKSYKNNGYSTRRPM
jgi:hypothetical protein